mmetsp:Transcript_4322/g.11306  ORF Transcript_4322/g.11306 Transcript_4322/m.11306 type:complete len:298 (-) Transcript_4322:1940-2833(-)
MMKSSVRSALRLRNAALRASSQQPQGYNLLVAARPTAIAATNLRLASAAAAAPTATSSTSDMNAFRDRLCDVALEQVKVHGWTQDAIAAAVAQKGWTLSMSGMITPNDLVSYWMDRWNDELEEHLQGSSTSSIADSTQADRIGDAIQFRLQRVVPLVQCNRWHEGMALGLKTPTTTRQQLHRIVELIDPHADVSQHAVLGMIYASTELHLLTDTSPDYAETWAFLRQRAQEYESGSATGGGISQLMSAGSVMGQVPVAATSAVAKSLFEGATSLLTPFGNAPSPMAGTNPKDYEAKK